MAKLAGNKQNVLLPQWQNEETLYAKRNELRMRALINLLLNKSGEGFTFSLPQGYTQCMYNCKHGVPPLKKASCSKQPKNSCFMYHIVACLDEEGEDTRKKGPDRHWLRRRAERGSFSSIITEFAAEDLPAFRFLHLSNSFPLLSLFFFELDPLQFLCSRPF